MIEIQASIQAGDAPMELIEHALATGRNHFKHGKNTFLLSKELREKTANANKDRHQDKLMHHCLPNQLTTFPAFNPSPLRIF